MNYRKRRATDELLPTTRPPKIPRSNHTYLQSASEHAALLPNTALSTRWVKAAEDLYTLVGDTAGAMLNFFLRGGGLFSRPESEQEDSASPPREPQQLPSPPSTSPSVQSISPPKQPAPLPADLPPPPRRRQPSKENAVASSSTQIDRSPESSRKNVTNTGLLTPTTSQTSAGSSSTSFLGLNPELSAEQRVRAAIHEAARRQNGLLRQHKPRRKHIFEQRHKKEVREDRIKTREEMITQLWNIRRGRGDYTGSLSEFRGWLDYRAHLEKMTRIEALEPSPSLVNLHEPTPFPQLTRSRTEPVAEASDGFIHRALQNAKETLKSKPPPTYSPSLDKLRMAKLQKAQAIEDRLRPKKKPLPESLPADEEAEVDELLRKRGVIAKCVREQVSDKDLQRLRPGQWLNDEIINFYGQMLLSRSEEASSKANKENKGGKGKLLDVHYFSSFFWPKLTGEGYEKARLAKWTKKFDIFKKDVILIPINHGNAHWTSAAINFRQKRIESYDSMGMPRQNVYRALRGYLDAEHRNKKKTPFDFTGWEDYTLEDTPQQENGYDCGVFTCQFLESLSRGEGQFAFTQSNMTYLRRRMIWEIGHTKLRDDS